MKYSCGQFYFSDPNVPATPLWATKAANNKSSGASSFSFSCLYTPVMKDQQQKNRNSSRLDFALAEIPALV